MHGVNCTLAALTITQRPEPWTLKTMTIESASCPTVTNRQAAPNSERALPAPPPD